jgi:putative hydrolase of the HAD superfamily
MIPIQAVLFDYGLVLSGPALPAAWANMKSITGLDEAALHSGYWAHRHPYDRGDLNGRAYWQNVGNEADIVLTPDQVDALIAADVDLWGEVNLPMLEWAQALQRAGMSTGILSNIGDAMSSGLLNRFNWLADFTHRTWSHTLNLAKPEVAIYAHAAAGLKTPPANILFIDDRAENIQAALDSGMQAIQYLDHAAFQKEMTKRGFGSLLIP